MFPDRFLRIVRTSAWYDLAITWPFALPWTFVWLHGRLADTAVGLGVPGAWPTLDATHVLLANLMGSVVVVWSLARLMDPSVRLGRLDAAARGLFAAWQVTAVLNGASALLLAFTVVEVAFGVLQALPVRRGVSTEAATPAV
ncbi:hypothetical protein [Ideonella sp.]|uniref:hypothetical protein n=1 Tax=Ideonella sp. TaxID=1929293 RepID=UPI0035AEB277